MPDANPPTAFLFDIGNVIVRFDFSLALRRVAAESEVHDPVEILARIDRVKVAYEDGQMDRAAFLAAAFDVLRYRGTEAAFISAWEEIFEPNPPMIALIERLHGRFPLFLLSNIGDIHRDYLFRTYPVFARFTAGTYSFAARASKPGPGIYQHAIRTHGLDPARTFFIDDLLPNITTARTLGFCAHHYHHDRHAALAKELAALGVV
ncbi:MAG: HAD-IA family hydrolase [Chthoniobacter sp.]|nr:HAD-IA family hydrolase [Chthoniobacter sp.]